MSIVVFILIGGVIGWLAAQLMGRDEGVVGSVAIGVIGSFIGSFISSLMASTTSYLSLTWGGILWSLLGSIILVAILNIVSHPRHHTAG